MFAKHRRELATWEYKLFLVALVVMFLHLTEDTLVHEESGSSVAAKLGATVLNLLLAAVGAVRSRSASTASLTARPMRTSPAIV